MLAAQAQLRRKIDNTFRAGMGRLARARLLPRLVDALFSLSLLMRGKVSPATAAAAELTYEKMREEDEKYTYYGTGGTSEWLGRSAILVFLLLQQLEIRF